MYLRHRPTAWSAQQDGAVSCKGYTLLKLLFNNEINWKEDSSVPIDLLKLAILTLVAFIVLRAFHALRWMETPLYPKTSNLCQLWTNFFYWHTV